MDRERFEELQKQKKTSVNGNGYSCSIEVFDLDGNSEIVNFDLVDSVSVSADSKLTENTMMTGDIISDHIYREPVTVSISGSYGLHSSRNIQFTGSWDKLGNVEEYFENIKNMGYSCSIITRSLLNNNNTRFKTRNNMILTSINWTHNQVSIGFNFTFTEQKTASRNTVDVKVIEDTSDSNLPDITDGQASSFVEDVLTWDYVAQLVVIMLKEDNMFTEEFAKSLASANKQKINGIIQTVTAFNPIINVIATLITMDWSASGWEIFKNITSSFTNVVISVMNGIYNWIMGDQTKKRLEQAQEKWGTEQFKFYEGDDNKNQLEMERFLNYVGGVADYVRTLDNYIKCYKIPTNNQQEMMIYIDDENYVFKFASTTIVNKITSTKYALIDMDGNSTSTIETSKTTWNCRLSTPSSEITSISLSSAMSDVSKCNDKNYLYKTTNNYRIYLMYIGGDKGSKENLTNYCVITSTINFDKFSELLKELIQNGGTIPSDKSGEYSDLN